MEEQRCLRPWPRGPEFACSGDSFTESAYGPYWPSAPANQRAVSGREGPWSLRLEHNTPLSDGWGPIGLADKEFGIVRQRRLSRLRREDQDSRHRMDEPHLQAEEPNRENQHRRLTQDQELYDARADSLAGEYKRNSTIWGGLLQASMGDWDSGQSNGWASPGGGTRSED